MTEQPLWIAIIIAIATGVSALMRVGLKAAVEQGVKTTFEQKIEQLRSELRLREQTLGNLERSLLTGRFERRALVERRQFEAVEAIWSEMNRLRPANMAVMSMKILKIDKINEEALKDERWKEIISHMKGTMPLADLANSNVNLHEPFVSPVLWSKFSAYRLVLISAVSELELIAKGVEKASDLIDRSYVIKVVKEALPNQSEYLDRVGTVGIYYLSDQLADQVLNAVRDEISGVEADATAVAQAQRLIKMAEVAEASATTPPLTGNPPAPNS